MFMEATQELFENDLGPNEWPVPNFDDVPTDEELEALFDLACEGAFEAWDGVKAPAPTTHDHAGHMTFEGSTSECRGCGQRWTIGPNKRGQVGWIPEGQEGRV